MHKNGVKLVYRLEYFTCYSFNSSYMKSGIAAFF